MQSLKKYFDKPKVRNYISHTFTHKEQIIYFTIVPGSIAGTSSTHINTTTRRGVGNFMCFLILYYVV